MKNPLFYISILFLFAISCGNEIQPNDKVLARLGKNELKLSNLKGVIASGITKADSHITIQNYTDKWLKK